MPDPVITEMTEAEVVSYYYLALCRAEKEASYADSYPGVMLSSVAREQRRTAAVEAFSAQRAFLDALGVEDLNGTLNPNFDPSRERRFSIHIHSHDPEDESGYRYKLQLTDRKYLDSDGFPIDTIAAGNNWQEAYTAAEWMIQSALTSPTCIF